MPLQTYEKKKGLESPNVPIQNAVGSIDLAKAAATGTALADSREDLVIDTERVIRTDQLDEAAFMAHPIEVHMHDAATEDEPQYCEVTVNGVYHCIVRGETKIVPRSHIAVIAQAKSMRVQQAKVTNPDGSMGYKEKFVLRLMYPFSVIHDPAGSKGAAWLRQLLANPT